METVESKTAITPVPKRPPKAAKVGDRNTAPTTTAADDLATHGQRKINLIWEVTQAVTTLVITGAEIYCAVKKIESKVLEFAFVAIISTYYARTNHTKTGGVGTPEKRRGE